LQSWQDSGSQEQLPSQAGLMSELPRQRRLRQILRARLMERSQR
jgi:hypothetical protein